MNRPFNLYQKIGLSFIIAIPVVVFIDVWLQYFFDITISYGFLVAPWVVLAIAWLYVFFSRKKWVALILGAMIFLCGVGYCHFIKNGHILSRRSISETHYSIAIKTRSYSIIKDYGFAEKVIAVKASRVFFDPDSKTGINPGYRIKVLKDTPDSLYIEINSGAYRVFDSLKKRSLWEKS